MKALMRVRNGERRNRIRESGDKDRRRKKRSKRVKSEKERR